MKTKPSIYVDLDETLIHAIHGFGRNPGKRTPVAFEGVEKYHTLLRPAAPKMLGAFRALGRVRMLTTATREYAQTHNEIFGLGFEKDDIVAREDYVCKIQLAYGSQWDTAGKDADPSAILVDNLPGTDENARLKIQYLGIPKGNYIQIRAFDGKDPDCFEQELEDILAEAKRLLGIAHSPKAPRTPENGPGLT